MRSTVTARRSAALLAAGTASVLLVTGCSAGSLGSSDGGGGGGTEITFLTGSEDADVASAKAIIEAFTAANPDITVNHDTRPGGSEGDNLVKTRLATGDMAEVFIYNSGSQLQGIKPAQNLHPMDDEPWASQLDETYYQASTLDGQLYGAPWGTAMGGAVLYNRPLYERLGLEVPLTWDEFMANNEAIEADGAAAPVEQTYGETWTSQLFVLGDYHNVETAVPQFAADYTAGKMKYADTEAARTSFLRMEQVRDAGYFNDDFASAELNDGIEAVATGTAAHYPMLGAVSSNIETVAPGKSGDVGLFALPGDDAATNGLTIWPGDGAFYVPKAVEGEELEAAKKFLAFMTTQEGCDAYAEGTAPVGPFLANGCELPSDVSQVAKDTQAYIDAGNISPALEFKSPIKGPALEQICVQIGTGQVGAAEAAELYDRDVRKQAQQLGLPGWD